MGKHAEKLQKDLEEPAFRKAAEHGIGEDLLTVVRVGSNVQDSRGGTELHTWTGMAHLVDAHNNQYTLSKPQDTTTLPDDSDFLTDIVGLLLATEHYANACIRPCMPAP